MTTYIFIRRPGKSVRQIAVVPARPRAHSAARAMHRDGHPMHFIALCLRIPLHRVEVIVGPDIFFKKTAKIIT